MTQPPIPGELETAILAVYRGPLEEFVSRRDALVKQLRADKRREDADRVKALRKPSRTAWVLDTIAHEDPASIERLAAAINAAQTGADLRTVMETVKAAIRDVAAAGARTSIRAGQPIEPNALTTALHAVIGDASAFGDLRAGRLAEVPEGGGLDILTATTINTPAPSPPPASTAPPSIEPARATRAQPATQESEAAIASRAELRRADASLADARERSEHAVQFVRNAQERLAGAEHALLHAQAEAQARRADLERAQRDAEAAAARLHDAERAVAAARARIADDDR